MLVLITILTLPAVAAVTGLQEPSTCGSVHPAHRPSTPKVSITTLLFHNLEHHAESTRTSLVHARTARLGKP